MGLSRLGKVPVLENYTITNRTINRHMPKTAMDNVREHSSIDYVKYLVSKVKSVDMRDLIEMENEVRDLLTK